MAKEKSVRPKKKSTDDVEGTKMSLNVSNGRFTEFGTNILTVQVPAELDENVPIHGMDFMNDLTGGGWTPSSVCLLTGTPGCGKTTLALQIADAMHDPNEEECIVVYLGTEEAAVQMRKTVRRLDLKNGFVIDDCDLIERCASWKNDERRCVMDHLRDLRAKHGKLVKATDENGREFLRYVGPRFVFICDSLQSHDDGQYYNGHTNTRTQVRVAEQLGSLAKSSEWGYPVVILIGQVNKSGEYAGPQALKHVIDMHLELKIDAVKDSPTKGKRLLQFTKNRFGLTGHCYVLQMTGRGLVEEGVLQNF